MTPRACPARPLVWLQRGPPASVRPSSTLRARGEGRAGGETDPALATVVVEVLAGSGRHGTLSVVRAR
ncbi:hypothetical protein [Streptomyces griseus]|uniref:hypothetical protein n=1 Tax=Streptomyces griseus TaxID=1911 RepID=UPI0036CC0853